MQYNAKITKGGIAEVSESPEEGLQTQNSWETRGLIKETASRMTLERTDTYQADLCETRQGYMASELPS